MIDQQKIKQAVTLLLEGIGEDVTREGLIDTPDRIARMYEEIYGGMEEDASTHLSKVFHIDSSEMVIEKDIPFYSTCEHHMLPFYGKVHIAYIPDGKVVGLSKLARTVEVFARRLQLQEQLTGQIVDALMTHIQPKGVMVMVEAEHLCMTMRGIKKPGSQTVTVARRGEFETNPVLEELSSGCWGDHESYGEHDVKNFLYPQASPICIFLPKTARTGTRTYLLLPSNESSAGHSQNCLHSEP